MKTILKADKGGSYHLLKNKLTKCACSKNTTCLVHSENDVYKWGDKELTVRVVKGKEVQLVLESKNGKRKTMDFIDIPEAVFKQIAKEV